MENLQIEVTKDELLILIGSVFKVQMMYGTKDEKLAELLGKLSAQAIMLLPQEELEALKRK